MAEQPIVSLESAAAVGARSSGLVIVSTARADGTIQTSLVNAGVLTHPVTGEPVVGFVSMPGARLANLRVRPQVTVTFRAEWVYAAVEGVAELIGPDDPSPSVSGDDVRLLLRSVFQAAGGSHDDYDEYDRVMAAERRCVVLVRPTRTYPKG